MVAGVNPLLFLVMSKRLSNTAVWSLTVRALAIVVVAAIAASIPTVAHAASPPATVPTVAAGLPSQALAAVESSGCPRSVWYDSDIPAAASTTSTSPYELGVKFRADRDGFITGVRFYKGAGNSGTHLGRLWSNLGEKLAEATFTAETASGWQSVSFATPVQVASGTTYLVSYYAPAGRYSYTYDYFASSSLVRPPLTVLKSGTDGPNGVYKNGAGFPNLTYRSINYWVDPVFDAAAPETCPASIWTGSQSPATAATTGAASIEVGVKFRSSQSGFIQGVKFFKGPGNTGTHIGRLWTSTGTKLAEGTFLAESTAGWQQVWFATPVAITAGTTYVASYYAPNGRYAFTEFGFQGAGVTRGPLTALQDGVDGGNGVYAYGTGGFPNSSFHAANYGVDVMFTTSSAVNCPCSVWPPTGEPAVQESTDSSSVEVGTRFRTMLSGYIKGIRFYKGYHNTGTHVGHLWSNTGTALATATFTAESGSGWQQVMFTNPVAVSAGTTYVASYFAPVGRYAYDDSYFVTQGATRGPVASTLR